MRILHSRKVVFVSKPRCGSTSVRSYLDSQMVEGDERCDYANEYPSKPELHPHMSAPAIINYIKKQGKSYQDYTFVTVIRHPIDMLWSYYNYFKPDYKSDYFYSNNYDPLRLIGFEEWLTNGSVGIGLWKKFCPSWISDKNFSPLSLEAHSCDSFGNNYINHIFRLEKLDELDSWFSFNFDNYASIGSVNGSGSKELPILNKKTIDLLIEQFPKESEIYDFYEYCI